MSFRVTDFVKDRQYYIDLYDSLTIEECLQWIEIAKKNGRNVREIQKIERPGFVGALGDIALYYKKGENYRYKETTIEKWINKDKLHQEIYDNAHEPNNIFCDHCNYAMEMKDKSLHWSWEDNPRVLFLFECPNCNKRKGIFDNGEVYKHESVCPKCKSILESKHNKKSEVLTILENCKKCGYEYKDVIDFEADEKRSKAEEARRQYLLDNFRQDYCLTKEEGDHYIEHQAGMDRLIKKMEEQKQKSEDPRYQKARALKKIKVFEMEKMIKEALEKEKYIELAFGKPEITKDVMIPFSVQESDSTRGDYDSQNNLKKLIKKTLENTNWRLMSEGISQRLGILSGRIRGYENEDDLAKLY